MRGIIKITRKRHYRKDCVLSC